MSTYNVTWHIEVEGDSPLEAAKEARAAMRRPDSIAFVFSVKTPKGKTFKVDLQCECGGVGWLHVREGNEFGKRVIQSCDSCVAHGGDTRSRAIHNAQHPECRWTEEGIACDGTVDTGEVFT